MIGAEIQFIREQRRGSVRAADRQLAGIAYGICRPRNLFQTVQYRNRGRDIYFRQSPAAEVRHYFFDVVQCGIRRTQHAAVDGQHACIVGNCRGIVLRIADVQPGQSHCVPDRGSGVDAVDIHVQDTVIEDALRICIISNSVHQRGADPVLRFLDIQSIILAGSFVRVGCIQSEHAGVVNLHGILFAGQIAEVRDGHGSGQVVERIIVRHAEIHAGIGTGLVRTEIDGTAGIAARR